jgi:hypothetical protein
MDRWRISVVALAAANAMDIQSSWGKRELNPALASSNGAFGVRGALLKSGVQASVVALELIVLHRRPSNRIRNVLAIINFGDAGLTTAMAGHNWSVPAH